MLAFTSSVFALFSFFDARLDKALPVTAAAPDS